MTCRHKPNDPNCSSYGSSTTPDAANYIIEKAEQVGDNLVLKVMYPNCKKMRLGGKLR